jgi:type IV secretion system protein VirB4
LIRFRRPAENIEEFRLMFKMFERPPDSFVPYAGHFPNSPDVAFLLDGTVFAMIQMDGVGYELSGENARNGRMAVMNNVMRHIADDNVVVYSHLVRHGGIKPSPVREDGWTSDFGRDLYTTYAAKLLSGLRTNTWFMTVMIRPPAISSRRLKLRKSAKPSFTVSPAQLLQLESCVTTVVSTLRDYNPRRLGLRSGRAGVTFTEIGEALFLIRTGVLPEIPYTNGSLGGAVYSQRVIVGPQSYDLSIPGRPRFGSIISYRNYPHSARPGCLNELLSAPYDLVLSQSFHFMLAGKSEARSALKQQQMRNLGDQAISLQEGLTQAMDDLVSGRVVSGMHHLSLAVYADSPTRGDRHVDQALHELDQHVGDAMVRLSTYGGSNPMREGRFGAECAYFAQLPGVLTWRTRPGELDSLAFSALSSFEGFPAGHRKGRWGRASARFRTQGGTSFDYITHDEDVGHTLLLGRTGVGKTALGLFIMACLEAAMGETGLRLIIDKDAGAKIMVELSGGRYLKLQRGRDSGLAPLRGLVDSAGARAMLLNLFRGLILRDGHGPIEAEEERRMARGIAAQMDMPADLRTMTGVREFMGYKPNGAGDRFEKWCRGGEMGWVLDNDEHLVDFNAPVKARIFGFDFGELMPKDEGMADDGACAAAAAVIIYQMREMMDGRRIACFFDECRFYLDSLGKVIEDFSLTGRKNELMVIMAAQEPAHFLQHPVGRSLIGQSRTKIAFPDKSADIAAYIDGIKFTQAAADQVKVHMNLGAGRRFLLWRDEGAVVCEFDLSQMPEEMAILSGRAGTVGLLDRITGDETADRYQEFRMRHRQATALAAAEAA